MLPLPVPVALLVAALAGARATLPPAEPPARAVSQERLMASLRALPTARSPMGDVESQRGLAETERLLVDRLKALGYGPTLQPLRWTLQSQIDANREAEAAAEERGGTVIGVREVPESTPELRARVWNNIIIDLPGRTAPREVIIVGAHFDAVPGSPGADDNGTGTAALLELAAVLKDRPMRRTVRLIFFNLEELGLKGSADYVRQHRARLAPPPAPRDPKAGDAPEPARAEGVETVIGMISLEMLGYFCDAPGCQSSPFPPIAGVYEPPTVGDSIILASVRRVRPFTEPLEREMLAASPGLKTFRVDFFPVAPPDLMRSDHGPFLLAGLPAVMLTDTANFRNPHYHAPTDTVETIDAERFTRVVRGVAGAVHAIAGPVEP